MVIDRERRLLHRRGEVALHRLLEEGRAVVPGPDLERRAVRLVEQHRPGGEGRVARAVLGVVDNVGGLQNIRLVAGLGRTVEGVVLRADGGFLAFGAVHYRVRALGLEGEAPTDGNGRFVLDGMPADNDVEVWAAGNASGAWGAQVATPSTSQLALTFVAPAW